MARTIRVRNTLDQSAPYSFLSTRTGPGGTALPVKNINEFVASWAVQLGKSGEETAEILVLGTATPSGTAVNTVGTVRFDHPVDTPVYITHYDQIVFTRSTAGTAGTASPVTDGTISIKPDNLFTQFYDPNGIDSYGYKAYFRNSVSGDVSSESDWLTGSGFSFYSLAKMRERAKNKLFSAGYLKAGDSQVNDWINEWLEAMNAVVVDVNQDYNLGTVDVAHGTEGLGTITSSDFKEVRKVDYTTNGTDWFRAVKIHITDFLPNQVFNETNPRFYYAGDTVIGKKPDGAVGTARVTYYRLGTILANDTDELPSVMKGYTKSFVNYGLANAYYLDGKEDLGDRFMAMANMDLEKFKNEITPRSKTGPVMVTQLEPTGAEDTYGYY